MTLNEGLVGLGLLLVAEGLLPFAAPAVWRDSFRKMTEMNDGQLRFIGAASMLGGVFLLVILN
ncbi:MAG: DUF2065 domain-containing protein [Thiobacillaceae bacterium]